ncbi:Retrovirus-related Pol polyprotein from transposon RE2 [Vitis vinifera]|uniref:Retrovirus-related Pol polyprotein from transposon RE2 n=2 Tax=Vitis vinifera TaxID=29760 RepID=A0A438JML3_VITVI|nr:Retrovirus-related Pol polyprotein from transposon RE2 [Vitis vinifera]
MVGSDNYLSWFASVELWFMGQGYEDHLITQETDIPEVDRRTVEEDRCTAKGLYTNDIQRLYKVAYAIVHISQQDLDLSTYIGQIASLKEDSSVPSLDDVFVRLLRISSTQTLPFDSTSDFSMLVSQTSSRGGRSGTRGRGQRPHCTYCNKLGHTRDCCYQLHGRPPRTAHPVNAFACLTHTSSLGPWILDSGASDHLSGPEYGEDDWHRRTSDSSPAVCISTDVPLLIHNRLGHPSLSKFQKMVPRFSTLSSLPCELCQLGKHTRVSFPKRLNNRAKSPFELVHTDVWGLCRTASTLGFQYFVTFIDDYSRSPFTSFMSHHGILHQSSCAHYSSTKWVAERKNRHLVETVDKLSAKAMKCLFLDIPNFRRSLAHSHVSPPDAMPPRPLQVYHRRPRVVAPLPFAEAPADSLPIPSASLAPALPSPNDLPIVVRKAPMKLFPIQAGDRQWWDEMAVLHSNGTWDLVVLPSGKSTVGCRWFYAVKVGPDGQIASVRLLLSMAAMCSWPLYQLDIKNAFLHGDLAEEVYMEATSWFYCSGGVWFSVQVTLFSIWLETISSSMCIYLVVYVDDIVITGSDQDAQSNSGVVLSQRKYALDILEETGMLDCKPVDTPMDPNVKLVPGQRDQFLQSPCDSHWDAVIRILRYIKSTPGQGVLYENRGHTQSKKQDVVARSSAEAEYRAMTLATCELIWLRHLLRELRFGKDEQMKLICDNQAALHIASNPIFHERTKHIEVDCHFIREKIASGCVATSFVNSNDQLADIFTKSLRGPKIKYICNKLGAYDVYAPA